MLRAALAAAFCSALFIGTAVRTGRADGECKVAKDEKTEVGKACKEGGIKRAKAVMKAMVKTAKKNGQKFECDTCHKDEEQWELTAEGKDKFKELLKAVATPG